MLRVPRGTPRPMASFSLRLRPESLGAGATGAVGVLLGGAEDGVEVEIGVVDEDLGVCEKDNDDDADADFDTYDAEGDGLLRVGFGKVVNGALVLVGVALMLVDESAAALVSRDPNVGLAVLVSVGWLVTDAGTSVGVV